MADIAHDGHMCWMAYWQSSEWIILVHDLGARIRVPLLDLLLYGLGDNRFVALVSVLGLSEQLRAKVAVPVFERSLLFLLFNFCRRRPNRRGICRRILLQRGAGWILLLATGITFCFNWLFWLLALNRYACP